MKLENNFERIKLIQKQNKTNEYLKSYFQFHQKMGMPKEILSQHKKNIERILKLDIETLSLEDTDSLKDFEYFLKLSAKIMKDIED